MENSKYNDFIIKKMCVNNIPLLVLSNKTNKVKPIIFLFHKLLEDKRHELPLGLLLAENDFFVVMMDMHGHGERIDSYYIEKKYDFNNLFKDIYSTANDISIIIEFLKKNMGDSLDFNNIGAIGVSIGGSIALVAGYLIDEIKFVASVIGACNWTYLVENDSFKSFKYYALSPNVFDHSKVKQDILKYDPCNNYNQNNMVPILFQHGALDFGIPINAVKDYYQKLSVQASKYDKETSIKFINYEKAGHWVTNEMELDLVNWVKQKLVK